MNQIVKNDVYTDFLALGTFDKNVDDLVRDTTQTLWNDIKTILISMISGKARCTHLLFITFEARHIGGRWTV